MTTTTTQTAGTEGRWITVAEKRINGVVVRRYLLRKDAGGYYFAGLDCSSLRRKTLAAVEKRAAQAGFDVFETFLEAGDRFEPVTYWSRRW